MLVVSQTILQTIQTSGKRLCVLAVLGFQLVGCAGYGTKSAGDGDTADTQKQGMSGEMLYQLLAAELAGNQGNLAAATAFYAEAANESGDSRIAARASYIAVYAGEYDRALKLLDRWKKLDPENEEVDRMYVTTYFRLKQPEQAAQHLEKVLERSGEDDRARALMVKTMLQKETDNVAALALLAALNKQEANSNLHMLVLQARYEAQQKHYDAAMILIDKVLSVDPMLDDVFLVKSRILAAQGAQGEAIQMIAKLLEQQPDSVALRLQYARMLVEQKQLVAAREQFLILNKQQPQNTDVLLSLGLLSIDTGEMEQAEGYLQQLLKLDQRVDVANYYLGRIAQYQNKPKIAISYYVRVTSGDYTFDSRLRIATLFAELDRADEGLEQLEALAEIQTDWSRRASVYLAQGEILRNLRRYQEGFEMYSRALQQKPDDPNLLYARAIIAEKVDRIDIAETDLLKVLSTEPENANALNALGYTLADRTGRLKEALEYIKRAAALVPDDPAILDSLGWVSYRLGKMEDALKWLAQAFEKLEDAEIAAHYGEVLWQSDQRKKAKEIWQRGQELDPENPVLVETLQRFKF